MNVNKSGELREFILSCLNNMLLAQASNVRSGWKSIFAVFATAGGDAEEQIAQLAFDILDRLVRSQFELVTNDFNYCVQCLVCLLEGPHSTISLGALGLLQVLCHPFTLCSREDPHPIRPSVACIG